MRDFTFDTTPSVIFGAGSIRRIGELIRARLGTRALVVTDAGLVRAGLVAPALDALERSGVAVAVYDAVVADPPESLVLAAADAARAHGADCVVGLGGGSSLDVAKVVALVARSGEALADIYGVGLARGPRLPLMLVPTTAGTGSEVTPISILTTGAHEKRGVVTRLIIPDVALLDPDLTLGLPPAVTAATGVDAMVHAIEAYTSASPNNNPLSRALALEALRLLGANIRRAVHEGGDREARSGMLLGSMLAGQAFANSPVAAVHALAYPLGGHFGIPHGLSNALVLPQVLRFNAPACGALYAEIAPHALPDLAPVAGADGFVTGIERLCAELGLPPRLRDAGVPESALDLLADDAMKQTRLLVNNPRPLTRNDARAIYGAAW
ncbi:iron-containing alcohol dehydrogenase [Salinarimonas soli]|uniref:Alcohol dehydrogenase 2 n=1 Tax=Salinarimonas soli TaxID=1638099 RepID=A0A5B2V9U5_9HYPH|nr:iron-containing alcohol dehydrogenase [Salinarimonas soli]KAA2235007.1 iron-containing alcohol dehydrogenase [Salinarimonas soli]